MMPMPTCSVNSVMTSGATLGRISRMMMRRLPKPSSFAADTKSLRATTITSDRTTRQNRVQSTSTIARMTLPIPVPKPTISVTDSTTGGSDIHRSTKWLMTRSIQPPK